MSAIKNLPNIVAVAINVHKLLKLKKLGFLAQPNLILTTNHWELSNILILLTLHTLENPR